MTLPSKHKRQTLNKVKDQLFYLHEVEGKRKMKDEVERKRKMKVQNESNYMRDGSGPETDDHCYSFCPFYFSQRNFFGCSLHWHWTYLTNMS